jgi:hypothetical protein
MHSRARRICAALLLAFLPVCSTAAPARGQPASATRENPGKRSEVPVRKTSDATGYSYAFDDDPLDALPNSTSSLGIVVRKRAGHVTLIRPRVQFVPEMLKSVEAL